MNFDLSDDQTLFRASVERFAGPFDNAARRGLRAHHGGYDRARWTSLADLGLIALAASEAHGGLGGSAADCAVVAEALGKTIAPDPWLENAVLPVRLLDAAGAVEALAPVLDGSVIVAAALAERGTRYSLIPRATRAQATPGGYRIDGEKTLVLGGAIADRLLVSALCDGETALFLVDAQAPGIAARAYRIADGSLASEVRLDAVDVPHAARLALDAAGLARAIADVRLCAAAELLGLAERAFDDTLDYVRQREQFGVPIGSFQALQHRLVDCYARLEQARSMVLRASLADSGDAPAWRRACAGARAYLGDNAGHIAREAVQMHGGMGITDELALGHAFKRIVLLANLFGDSDTTLADYAQGCRSC